MSSTLLPMQNACRLSQRWHQQFCRSPSFLGHQKCLQNLQPSREYRQVTRARIPRSVQPQIQRSARTPTGGFPVPAKSDIVVREYEHDPHDRSKLNRVEPNEEIRDELADTRMELMKLDQELAVMREGPFGPRSEFMRALPEDEREQLLQALAQEGILQGQQEDLLTMAELERLAEEDEPADDALPRRLGVTLKIPRKDQAYIRHFNRALQGAEDADGHDIQQNLNLYRWYLRCQQQVHNFSNILSKEVWRFLWDSQVELNVRPKHLIMLANDMQEAKHKLSTDQLFTYIEALDAVGDSATALQVWQENKEVLRSDPELSEAFWKIGVRMFAATGQPLKAQEFAMNALISRKAGPDILIPVITAWAKHQDPASLTRAWACYLKLREKAGDTMLPEMYERISNAFLDTNHGNMALTVFKDMLIMKESSSYDSSTVHKQATKHIDEVLQNATTEEQINRIGLSALLVLPRQFQNRFFFTSWIKKLIGEKRIDSAAMVVELMYERGIAPDAKPLNGIIGAWLREGKVGSQQKAENLAWSMIEARADFVSRTRTTSQSEGQRYRKIALEDRAVSTVRRIPAATVETFSILLQYYTRRQNSEQAEKLTSTMIHSCQIRPNSYIMNHWLFADLRAGRLQAVWDKYSDLSQDIRPDLETFAALWDTAKAQFSKAKPAYSERFTSARVVFAEMQNWFSALSITKAQNAREDFSAELYEQIVRCFCLSTDLPGTLLAVHHMARSFESYPTDNALRLICGQAARLLPQDQFGSTRSARSRRSTSRQKSVMAQVADIMETIEAKRKISLVENGADADALEDPETEAAQQLRLIVLTEFMCMFMQKTQSETGSYRNDVKIAAETMRVDLAGIDLTSME